MESHDTIPHDLPKVKKSTLIIVAVVLVVAFVALFFLGYLPHRARVEQREQMAQQTSCEKPIVQTGKPKPSEDTVKLSLPADARAFAETALYARITGYLHDWKYDIGARVKKGDVLADIAAPDTDADLAQAQANLDQAKANVNQQQVNYELADVTLKRYEGLIETGGVTQQQLDQYRTSKNQAEAALVAAQATVKSSDAAVVRLQALVGFEKIYAPFDGTITARNYDNGALISANSSGPGQELFDIAADDTLRVFVSVPQTYSTLLKFGSSVGLTVRNYPDHVFSGVVARSTGILDPSTRTLRTELDFDNKDHLLYAGMYGEANFTIVRDHPVLIIPTSAMLFEANGTQVAIVDDQNKIHFKKITVGRDYGTEIEVLTGLTGSEQVVVNPGEKISEGTEVSIAPASGDGPASPAPSNKSADATTQTSAGGERVAETDASGHTNADK